MKHLRLELYSSDFSAMTDEDHQKHLSEISEIESKLFSYEKANLLQDTDEEEMPVPEKIQKEIQKNNNKKHHKHKKMTTYLFILKMLLNQMKTKHQPKNQKKAMMMTVKHQKHQHNKRKRKNHQNAKEKILMLQKSENKNALRMDDITMHLHKC